MRQGAKERLKDFEEGFTRQYTRPVEAVLALVLGGLLVGALARLALPGPDPIPIWATVLLGVVGALLGGGVGLAAAGPMGAILASVVVASFLLYLYRRLVQKRPITGPEARRRPGREAAPVEPPEQRLRRLQQLRDDGLISDEEFELRQRQLGGRI
jgi:uncharacterized membrane protein YeaQ/YmgE (transglycosylase-associated protein family)